MESRWFVRGDIDGFFGLFVDNLLQLMLAVVLSQEVCGLPSSLVLGRILPGAALSILFGNLFYAWQAKKTGRRDATALPFGINTPSLLAYVFLIMGPVYRETKDPTLAWRVGLSACVLSGVFEIAGAFAGGWLRRNTPRAALLSALAGIAITFISMGFVFQIFARPWTALFPALLLATTYASRTRLPLGVPAGLTAVVVGTVLAWLVRAVAPSLFAPSPAAFALALHLPVPVPSDAFRMLASARGYQYLAVVFPMGLFNVIGSLQNLESAEAAGDTYETMPSLLVNGIATIVAALFGNPFPTTIYIGHPGWKALGARAGYSVLNGVFITIICLTGTLAWIAWAVPIDAGMAIVLWIGIVISAQAFQATPREHAPAVVIGLLPGIGAWAALMAKNGLKAAGMGTAARPFGEMLIAEFQKTDTWIHGVFSLEQGFLFTSMLLSAATVGIIERKWTAAAAWCGLAAVISATGLMHSYQWTDADTVLRLTPAWPFAIAYAAMAAMFFLAQWITEPTDAH